MLHYSYNAAIDETKVQSRRQDTFDSSSEMNAFSRWTLDLWTDIISVFWRNLLIVHSAFKCRQLDIQLNINIPIAHIISMGSESFVISNLISKVYSRFPNNFAFHSKIQASDYPFIENPIVIGNGFNLGNYIFQDCKNGPLGWVGRVAPEKGLEDAAYVANALGEKLNIWGILDNDYYFPSYYATNQIIFH